MTPHRLLSFALPGLLSLSLAGCLPPTEELETTTLTLSGSGPVYVDLLSGAQVEESAGWDLQWDGWNLFLNGGESGDGKAGGIDMELLDLDLQFEDMNRKNQLVWFLFFDSYACALSDWWWYGLDGTHTLFSNYHRYVVRRGERDFMVQMLDYYRVVDGAVESGFPEFRWAEIPSDGAEPTVFTEDLDATAGGLSADADDPDNSWTYFSFDDGVLALDDAAALQSEAWDLGFKRFNIKSNSGPSGPGGVLTVDPDRESEQTGEQVLAYDPETELANFVAGVQAFDPDASEPFVEDAVQPVLRRWIRGVPGDASSPATLWDGRWFLATDRSGGDVTKLRVTGFEGTDEAGPSSVTIEWAVLP